MTKFLTRREAADMMRVVPATLCNMAARGEGPPFLKTSRTNGGRTLYREADILAYLERRTGRAGGSEKRTARKAKA